VARKGLFLWLFTHDLLLKIGFALAIAALETWPSALTLPSASGAIAFR
jgi:hypothetical protein